MADPQPGTSRSSSLLSFPSPKKKRSKKGSLRSWEKQTLINVFKYVEESWPQDKYPYKKDIVNKTAEIMGMSAPTVYSVLKEYKTTRRVQSPPPAATKPSQVDSLDDMDMAAVRRKVHQMFFNNEQPTINKIMESVNSDESLPNLKKDVLTKVIKKLGFKYLKRSRKSMLIDKPEIALWRVKYLTEMVQYRKEEKKIYYLDETWVNEGHTRSSTWQDTTIQSSREAHREGLSTGLKNPSGKGKRLILAHIGSSTGFVEGGELIFEAKKSDSDYHSEMDAYNFEKWFQTILPKLEKDSIVVMDNASYHSRRKEKVPTNKTKKADIQKWLKEKNIEYGEKDIKLQLLENSDYHSEMDAYNFEKWFQTILPKLEKDSIVVMDNASYHSRRKEKVPNKTKKADIQKWLKEKNIEYGEKDIKLQLLEKVKVEKHKYQSYVIDEMAKESGVTVLRLPPYHCELNPIELIWAQVKGYIAQKNTTFKMAEIKQLLPEALGNIDEHKWKNCEGHVIKEEIKMMTLDHIIDTTTDKFVINTGDESDSSTSDSDSCVSP